MAKKAKTHTHNDTIRRRNKARRLKKHLNNHPHDKCAIASMRVISPGEATKADKVRVTTPRVHKRSRYNPDAPNRRSHPRQVGGKHRSPTSS